MYLLFERLVQDGKASVLFDRVEQDDKASDGLSYMPKRQVHGKVIDVGRELRVAKLRRVVASGLWHRDLGVQLGWRFGGVVPPVGTEISVTFVNGFLSQSDSSYVSMTPDNVSIPVADD